MVKGKKKTFLYKELQQKVSSKVEMNRPDNNFSTALTTVALPGC